MSEFKLCYYHTPRVELQVKKYRIITVPREFQPHSNTGGSCGGDRSLQGLEGRQWPIISDLTVMHICSRMLKCNLTSMTRRAIGVGHAIMLVQQVSCMYFAHQTTHLPQTIAFPDQRGTSTSAGAEPAAGVQVGGAPLHNADRPAGTQSMTVSVTPAPPRE